jgi:hypothetical protein
MNKKKGVELINSTPLLYKELVYGKITVSITWITPLDVLMSVATTLALLILTPASETDTFTSEPSSVVADFNLTTSAAITLPATT